MNLQVNPHRLLIAFAIATGLVQTARSQSDRVIQISQVAQTARGFSGQSPAVVEDLGDIRPLADKTFLQKLRITAALRSEYVSNALSAGNHTSGDFLLLPSVDAAIEQPLTGGLSLSFNARAESYIYAKFDQASFWGFSGSAFLNYQPTKDCARLYAGIEPYWYASLRNGDQLSESLGISAGIQKEWTFNRDQTVLFVGYHFTDYISFPAADDRLAHRATVGVTHQLRPSLYGQLYYSYQHSDYISASRRDSRNLVGVNFVYRISNHWSGSVTTYFADNDSTVVRASYQTVGTGLGVSYQF